MQSKLFGILGLAVLLSSSLAEAKSTTARIELADRVVEPVIDLPRGHGPHPVLVLVADTTGSSRDVYFGKIVRAANLDGYVTVRLDWTYKKKKGTPSSDLKTEAEELGLIVNELLGSRMFQQYEIDPARVALIVKGVSAKVAMMPESGGTSEKIKAALLVDPSCDDSAGSFGRIYSPFIVLKIPRMLISSRGNGACPFGQIYPSLKDFDGNASAYLFEKDTDKGETTIAATLLWLKSLGWVTANEKARAKKVDTKKYIRKAQSAGTHP